MRVDIVSQSSSREQSGELEASEIKKSLKFGLQQNYSPSSSSCMRDANSWHSVSNWDNIVLNSLDNSCPFLLWLPIVYLYKSPLHVEVSKHLSAWELPYNVSHVFFLVSSFDAVIRNFLLKESGVPSQMTTSTSCLHMLQLNPSL